MDGPGSAGGPPAPLRKASSLRLAALQDRAPADVAPIDRAVREHRLVAASRCLIVAPVTSLLRGALGLREPTYTCALCLSISPRARGFLLSGCGHRFCVPCLQSWLKARAQALEPLACPWIAEDPATEAEEYACSSCAFVNPGTASRCAICQALRPSRTVECTADVSGLDLFTLLAPEVLERYHAAMASAQGATEGHGSCARCGQVGGASRRAPRWTCLNCSHVNCFVHGDSHPGLTCRQAARRERRRARLDAHTEGSLSRRCPACKRPSERAPGPCERQRCVQCGHAWCWRCEQSLPAERYTRHYAPWNALSGCGGRPGPLRFVRRVLRLIYALVALPLVLPVCVLLVLLSVAWCLLWAPLLLLFWPLLKLATEGFDRGAAFDLVCLPLGALYSGQFGD